MSSRTIVARTSLALALGGWLGALWSWLDHGAAAGVNPGFILALSVGICFTVVHCVAVVMPDSARLYALGWIDRGKQCTCFDDGEGADEDVERHLRAL